MREQNTIEKKDFRWSETGDFLVFGGDLRDTRELTGLGFIEEVEIRMKSGINDWGLEPEKGANLDTYRGAPNIKKTWEAISSSITYSLIFDAFLTAVDFTVYVAPVAATEVAIRIDFSDNITKGIDEKLQSVRMIYNLDGQGPFIAR
jgi:hypothetical protein